MTAICLGGTSSAKPIAPAVGYFSGNILEGIVESIFLISESWASLLVFAAIGTVTIETATFCATDPPSLVWPDATDIAYIVTHVWDVTSPSYAKLFTVVQNALWYSLCQCNSIPTPAAPTPPTYPTTAPVINPGGFATVGTPCLDQISGTVQLNPGINGVYQIWPGSGSSTGFYNTVGQTIVIRATEYFQVVSGTSTAPANAYIKYQDSSGVTQFGQPVYITSPGPYTPGNTYYGSATYTLPAGARGVQVIIDTSDDTATDLYWVEVQLYCGTPVGGPTLNCCPPDPRILATLQAVQQLLQEVYSIIPARTPNYAALTAHAGLSGNGSITLGATTIAVQTNVTNMPAVYTQIGGTPFTYIGIGWITPVTNEGPQAGIEITRGLQVIPLPDATIAIDYTLPPGEVLQITELLAG